MATRNDNNHRWLDPESLEEIDLTVRRLQAGDSDGVAQEVEESVQRAQNHLNSTKIDLAACDHPNSVELEGH